MDAHYKVTETDLIVILPDGRELGLTPYTSSRLSHAGYDEDRGLLYIAFPPTKTLPKGTIYEYRDVEIDTWEGFLDAESKGSYAIARIMGKRGSPAPYAYRKVERLQEADASADPTSAHSAEMTTQTKAVAGTVIVPPVTVQQTSPTAKNGTSQIEAKAERSPEDTIPELPTKDEELPSRALAVQSSARALVVGTPAQYEQAANRLRAIAAERKLVEARAKVFYDPAFAAYKAARDLRDEALSAYDAATSAIKAEMLRFDQIETRQRQEAEQAERRRLEEESRANAKRESEERAKRDAEYLRAQGEEEIARQVEASPLPIAPKPVAPVVMARAIPQTEGVGRREKWAYRIVDEAKIPFTHEFYTLDPKKLQNRTRLKAHGSIEGALEVYDEGSITVR